MTPWISVVESVHCNWDIQMNMAFVEATIESNTEQSRLARGIL